MAQFLEQFTIGIGQHKRYLNVRDRFGDNTTVQICGHSFIKIKDRKIQCQKRMKCVISTKAIHEISIIFISLISRIDWIMIFATKNLR